MIVKIDKARFDEDYMHVTWMDKRILSIPLKWIPTLYHSKPAEREKYEINQTKRMIVWDIKESEINEEIRVEDYLGPTKADTIQVNRDYPTNFLSVERCFDIDV